MKKRFMLVIVFVVLTVLALFGVIYLNRNTNGVENDNEITENENTDQVIDDIKNDFKLTITLPDDEIKVNEPFIIKGEIKNISDKTYNVEIIPSTMLIMLVEDGTDFSYSISDMIKEFKEMKPSDTLTKEKDFMIGFKGKFKVKAVTRLTVTDSEGVSHKLDYETEEYVINVN